MRPGPLNKRLGPRLSGPYRKPTKTPIGLAFKAGLFAGRKLDKKFHIADDLSDRIFKFMHPDDPRARGTAIYKYGDMEFHGAHVPWTQERKSISTVTPIVGASSTRFDALDHDRVDFDRHDFGVREPLGTSKMFEHDHTMVGIRSGMNRPSVLHKTAEPLGRPEHLHTHPQPFRAPPMFEGRSPFYQPSIFNH